MAPEKGGRVVRANHAASEVGQGGRSSALQYGIEPETAQVGHRGFTQVDNSVLRDATLTRTARLVYALLRSYGWQDAATFVGEERLASDLGASRATVTRALRELVTRSLVERRRRRNGSGWTSSLTTFTERVADGAASDAQTATAAPFPVMQDVTGMQDAVGAFSAPKTGVLTPSEGLCVTSDAQVCVTSDARRIHSTTKTQGVGVVLTEEQVTVRDALERLGFNGATAYVKRQDDVGRLIARVEYAQANGLGPGWVRSGEELPAPRAEPERERYEVEDGAAVLERLQARQREGATPVELREVWTRSRDTLRASSTTAAWTQYYQGLELVSYGDGRATVAHRDAAALDFVAGCLAVNVARALRVSVEGLTFGVLSRDNSVKLGDGAPANRS